MITTIVTVLGVATFFIKIAPGIATWWKVVLTMILAIPYVLDKLMDWAVEGSFVRVQFLLRGFLSFLCWLLSLDSIVLPVLLQTRTKWACPNQAFGSVWLIPEGKRGSMCTLAPTHTAAYRDGDKPAVDTQVWSDFLDKKKEFVIGRCLVVTLELPVLDDITDQHTELSVMCWKRSWHSHSSFMQWDLEVRCGCPQNPDSLFYTPAPSNPAIRPTR